MAECFASLSPKQLRQITHVLLREWVGNVSESSRGKFVDFGVVSSSALGLQHKQRFRLFPYPATTIELQQIQKEAAALGLDPVAVAPLGLKDGVAVPSEVAVIDADAFEKLCQESGVLIRDDRGQFCVDRAALRELKDHADTRFSFVNKAANEGYEMTYRDLTGFADYLRNPSVGEWRCPEGVTPRFLVISSEICGGTRAASFTGRQKALEQKVPGARLAWMRAPDLVRFSLAIEAAEVAPAHRESVCWAALLDAGDVHWDAFQTELRCLAALGYTFPEVG